MIYYDNVEDETEAILADTSMMKALEKALAEKPEYSFEDVFGVTL
ncbi:MAG: hypothetical protein PHQ23_11495 [Candidatus Wallbacteria bacterium]|nr:hypothetical protein [Candidatus Wallbacteria bacterium]